MLSMTGFGRGCAEAAEAGLRCLLYTSDAADE